MPRAIFSERLLGDEVNDIDDGDIREEDEDDYEEVGRSSEDESDISNESESESSCDSDSDSDSEIEDTKRKRTRTRQRGTRRKHSKVKSVPVKRTRTRKSSRKHVARDEGAALCDVPDYVVSPDLPRRRKRRCPERLADWMMPLAEQGNWRQPQSYERHDEVIMVHISHISAEQAEEARAASSASRRQSRSGNGRGGEKRRCPTCRVLVKAPIKIFAAESGALATCPVCGESKRLASDDITLSCGHACCNACFTELK